MSAHELENWSPEDRIALFRAAEYLGGDANNNPDRVGLCFDAILNDLEAYHDPDQGLGLWLYVSEAPVLKELAERLNLIVGSLRPIDAGRSAVAHPSWPAVREAAADLAKKNESEWEGGERSLLNVFNGSEADAQPELGIRSEYQLGSAPGSPNHCQSSSWSMKCFR